MPPSHSPLEPRTARSETGFLRFGLAAVLVLAVFAAGGPGLSSPWIQGDEFIFIVNNPEVTGAGVTPDSMATRLGMIFRYPPAEDLYQPIPILTYAAQWSWVRAALPRDATPAVIELTVAEQVRGVDLLLHSINALVLWSLLARLLIRWGPAGFFGANVLAWMLALLWALHPVQAHAYAADMGRTHLLAALFALLALRFYFASLGAGGGAWFALAIVTLVLGMLCKPTPGWFLVIFVVHALATSVRRAAISVRVWLAALICAVFAGLALATSRQSGLMQDAAAGLFGDPVARSLYAVTVYAQHVVAPLALSTWYLPDPNTNWANWRAWVGAVLTIASAIHATRCWRRAETRMITLGWVWFWATLLPVIGLIGAREAAAVDRYLYLPLGGLALVLGGQIALWIMAAPTEMAGAVRRVALVAGIVCSIPLFLASRHYVETYRSTLQRALGVVRQNPGDPRAFEGLAAAYNFARSHALPPADTPILTAPTTLEEHFRERMIESLNLAASSEHLGRYFPSPDKLAAFHRRLSYAYMQAAAHQMALNEAKLALAIEPDDFNTWNRLASAYRELKLPNDALQAYGRAEALLPADAQTRSNFFASVGDLYLTELDRPDQALGWLQKAVTEPGATVTLGTEISLAQAEIRAGKGDIGLKIIMSVLERDPANRRAQQQIGEYSLMSGRFDDAFNWYRGLLAADPTDYRALRGFSEACGQLGRWHDAIVAWDDAAHRSPQRPEFQAFLSWTLALAGVDEAAGSAEKQGQDPAGCRFGHLARAVLVARKGTPDDIQAAVAAIEEAEKCPALPQARELERAEAAIRHLQGNGKLPAQVVLLRIRILGSKELPPSAHDQARTLLDEIDQNNQLEAFQSTVAWLRANLPNVGPEENP